MSPPAPGFAPGERSENFGAVWKRLILYMGRYRYAFFAAIAMSAIGTAISLLGPNMISDLTDTIKDGLAPGIRRQNPWFRRDFADGFISAPT